MKSLTKLLAALSALTMLLTACETMEGFGRDVEKAGDEIEESADELSD